jgi:hypothetical protein
MPLLEYQVSAALPPTQRIIGNGNATRGLLPMIMAIREVANTAIRNAIFQVFIFSFDHSDGGINRVHSEPADPMVAGHPTTAFASITGNNIFHTDSSFLHFVNFSFGHSFDFPPASLRFRNDGETRHGRYGDGNSQGNAHRHGGCCES